MFFLLVNALYCLFMSLEFCFFLPLSVGFYYFSIKKIDLRYVFVYTLHLFSFKVPRNFIFPCSPFFNFRVTGNFIPPQNPFFYFRVINNCIFLYIWQLRAYSIFILTVANNIFFVGDINEIIKFIATHIR